MADRTSRARPGASWSGPRKPEPDPYEVLQVSPQASAEVIQAAYRALARHCHPDLNSGGDASDRMRTLNAAYATLSDPARRTAYDARTRTLRTRELRQLQTRPRPTPLAVALNRRETVGLGVAAVAASGGQSVSNRRLFLALLIVVAVILATTVFAFWAIAAVLDDDVPTSPALEQVREIGQIRDVPAQPFLNPR